ncbi:MAG: hypothetical protein JXQ72_13885 [Anaerolineae bacterium]|nr:hypothetical protein [Anaerolineae bacterium]
MEHVRHLSVAIGPRPPGSDHEREAAAYVHDLIRRWNGDWTLINQPFRSVSGFRHRIAPLAALTGLNLLFGRRKDGESQIISGLLSVGLSIVSRDTFLARPTIWESLLPRGESQNVIVRIPPRQSIQRRVIFVAHLDSGVHRLTTHPVIMKHLPRTLGGLTIMALTGGVLTALAGRNQRWRAIRTAIGVSALGGAALAVADEMGACVSGANSNASGVATLLGLAEALSERPLESTEVVLAFTGGATAVSGGADILATEYGGEWHDDLWVVANNVGVGELCWVTRHGISPYAHYHPHPDAVKVMEQVADARPDLGLMGKTLLTLDEVSQLRDRDLRAVALMAYDRVTGLIPHWRQNSDTVHVIEPAVVERAGHALWTIAQTIDQTVDQAAVQRLVDQQTGVELS